MLNSENSLGVKLNQANLFHDNCTGQQTVHVRIHQDLWTRNIKWNSNSSNNSTVFQDTTHNTKQSHCTDFPGGPPRKRHDEMDHTLKTFYTDLKTHYHQQSPAKSIPSNITQLYLVPPLFFPPCTLNRLLNF